MRIKKTQAAKELARFLRSRHFWSIVTMLRGPDFGDSQELKRLTVGRIRAVAGITESQALRLGIVITTTPLNWGELQRRDYLLWHADANNHFCWHYKGAVNALRIVAGYDLQTETPIKRTRR